MFHRRRAHSNPPIKTTPSASAQTAAAQAFLASRNSNANLSAAAAAAALRSHTTTPTPVGQIQTKRMAQRRGSMSSVGSAPGNVRPGGALRRQSSSGSMTERTFRSPSPSRGPSPRSPIDHAPPVPALPKGYVSPPPPLPQKSHRRASSMEPPVRVNSPPPQTPGGRGVSLDRGPGVMATRRTGPSTQRVTSLASVSELERAGSRGSINFSRPISAQHSPSTSPITDRRLTSLPDDQAAERPAASIRPMSPVLASGEVHYLQQTYPGAANQPTKKQTGAKLDKTDLAGGGQNMNPAKDAAVASTRLKTQPTSVSQQQPTETKRTAAGRMTKAASAMDSDDDSLQGRSVTYGTDSNSMSERAAAAGRPATFNTRAALLLSKQPSIVREDREAEEQEEGGISASAGTGARLTNGKPKIGRKGDTAPATSAQQKAETQQHSRSVSQPTVTLNTTDMTQAGRRVSATDASLGRGNDSIRGGRHQSLSPARSAHFSPQPILKTPTGTKHQPPPRSVSPAKSALKTSPSPRGLSPSGGLPGGRGVDGAQALSETSDTVSILSEDGLKARKKKNRVSFDDDAVLVVPGRAVSPPTSPDSPATAGKDHHTRTWLGLGHGKKRPGSPPAGHVEEGEESMMQPTPALPSFGSIRGQRERESSSSSTVKQSHAPAPWAQETLARINASSDQALGAIVSQDAHAKATRAGNEPLPPEVTSVEGTGYVSDSEGSVYSTDGVKKPSEGLVAKKTAAAEAHAEPYRELASPPANDDEVYTRGLIQGTEALPAIAIQPATPAEDSLRREGWVGGSPTSAEPQEAEPSSQDSEAHHPLGPTPATVGIAEPEPEGLLASSQPVKPVVGGVAEAIRHQTEPDQDAEDTGESIYSDAAEDLSDLEGDGFGSINAIVESPAVDTFGIAITTPPESPSGKIFAPKRKKKSKLSRLESNDSQPGPEEGWDNAQAYWSVLSESRKAQLERAAVQEGSEDDATQAKPKPKKKKAQKAPLAVRERSDPLADEQHVAQAVRPRSPPATGLKQSIWAPDSTSVEPHMRKSMRTGDKMMKPPRRQTPQSPSVPATTAPEPRGALQKKYRPVSAVPLVNYNTTTFSGPTSHSRAVSGGSIPASVTPLTPKSAKKKTAGPAPASNLYSLKPNDSDSESSFRKRRPKTSDGGRYTMRRSMRDPPAERPLSPAVGQSGPFSIRSSSPTGSTARRPLTSGHGMRTTMRGSTDLTGPTLRQERTKSPIRGFGLGRGSKIKAGPAPTKSRFSSKFGDSSDEEGQPATFRSCFGDSSDEDEAPQQAQKLTPVRGIPRRADQGDSSDLDDSSENEKPRPRQRAPPPQTTKPEGLALAAGSLRPNAPGPNVNEEMGRGLQAKKAAEKDSKRRSFFGFGRKKAKDDSAIKQQPDRAAVPLTPDRKVKSTPASGTTTPTGPRSPRLQRRNTPMTPVRMDSNTWPPPPPIPGSAGDRPNTADGPGASLTMRPDMGVRSSTMDTPGRAASKRHGFGQNGVAAETPGPVLGRSGKKKRFPKLRKAFGLHD